MEEKRPSRAMEAVGMKTAVAESQMGMEAYQKMGTAAIHQTGMTLEMAAC